MVYPLETIFAPPDSPEERHCEPVESSELTSVPAVHLIIYKALCIKPPPSPQLGTLIKKVLSPTNNQSFLSVTLTLDKAIPLLRRIQQTS